MEARRRTLPRTAHRSRGTPDHASVAEEPKPSVQVRPPHRTDAGEVSGSVTGGAGWGELV